MADKFILEPIGGGSYSQDGSNAAAIFVPTVHADHEPARIKRGDVTSLRARALSDEEHRPDTAMPAVDGVEWSLDGGDYAGNDTASDTFDLTADGTIVHARVTALFATAARLDLSSWATGWVETSPVASVPSGTDTGVGADTGEPEAVAPVGSVPEGSDAGTGSDTGQPEAVAVASVPSGTDAGVGADTGEPSIAYDLFVDFTGADGATSPITDNFYTWANKISADGVISVNTQSVQSNKLSTRITPTVNAKFVVRELVSKAGFALPTGGETLHVQATIGYPSVRENQFGIGVVAASSATDPGSSGAWSGTQATWQYAHRFRAHFSQSAALSLAKARVEHLSSSDILATVVSNDWTAPTNTTFDVLLEITKSGTNTYNVNVYIDDGGEPIVQATNVHFEGSSGYLYLYNQVGNTGALAITFDDVKVW